MLKLQECEVDANERPLFPHKIVKTEVNVNYLFTYFFFNG